MLISIGYMCLMLCAPLDWQYAELPSSASDAVLCSVLVRKKNKNNFMAYCCDKISSNSFLEFDPNI